MKKKRWILSLGMAAVMLTLILAAVGGTLAYLIAVTDPLTNTFELGDIEYTLVLNKNLPQSATDAGTTEPTEWPNVTPESPKTEAAGSVTFSLDNEPKLTGYTFTGWWDAPSGGKQIYPVDTSEIEVGYNDPLPTVTEGNRVSLELWAQWGTKSYVIRYHANGGKGTMADQVIEYNKLVSLTKNTFTKSDYTFMGWSLSEDDDTVTYIDGQEVVNLREEGYLDLYAVWEKNPHTVYFDYNNNGYGGNPTSKAVLHGEEYGVLPTYPFHPTTNVSENEVMSYLFTGWYTDPTGGERVYPSDIYPYTEDSTLYAHWQKAPTNNVIKDIEVRNNPDDDKDGVVDDINLKFKCSSSFEKYNIPLTNLVPGQKYTLTYTTTNNASFGDYVDGYRNSEYASYVVSTKELTGGLIKNAAGEDRIATWNDRIEPDGVNDGSQKATNDTWLQGPWKDRTITFTATQSTMYWTWDFGLIEDHIEYEYNITDIKLEPVVPEIEFENKKLILHNTSKAQVLNDSSSDYSSNFVFDGDGYAETMYFPITGLTVGTTYTITFDHKITGALINNAIYDYGCGISSGNPTNYGSKMDSLGATWISEKPVFTALDTTQQVTLTFTATDDTAYWVWNMANCSDSKNCTIDVKVTNFSASHAEGGNITYYTAISSADFVMYAVDSHNASANNSAAPAIELPENVVEGEPYCFTTMPEDSDLAEDIYLLTESEILYAESQGWTFYGWLLNTGAEPQMFDSDTLGDLDETMFWFFLDNPEAELRLTPLYDTFVLVWDEPTVEAPAEDENFGDEIIVIDPDADNVVETEISDEEIVVIDPDDDNSGENESDEEESTGDELIEEEIVESDEEDIGDDEIPEEVPEEDAADENVSGEEDSFAEENVGDESIIEEIIEIELAEPIDDELQCGDSEEEVPAEEEPEEEGGLGK